MTRTARRRPTLIIMVKEPIAGRIKTRLAREAGTAAATRFMRHNIALTLLRLARDPRWTVIVSIAPDAATTSRMLPYRLQRRPQGRGDLGARMAGAAESCKSTPVLIIGADIPAIRARDIAMAFGALRNAAAVIGPSDDGGYWLIGFSKRRHARRAFLNVRWSSPQARGDTERNLDGLRLSHTIAKSDVDDARDLHAQSRRVGRLIV